MARPAIKLGQLTVLRDKKSAWLSRKILWREETQQRTSPPPSYPSRLCITAKQDPGGRGGSPVPNDDRSINFIKHPSRRAEMRDGLESAGFKLTDGPQNAGQLLMVYERGGGESYF